MVFLLLTTGRCVVFIKDVEVGERRQQAERKWRESKHISSTYKLKYRINKLEMKKGENDIRRKRCRRLGRPKKGENSFSPI